MKIRFEAFGGLNWLFRKFPQNSPFWKRKAARMKQKLREEGTPVTGTVMQLVPQGIQENSAVSVYISFAPPDGAEQILKMAIHEKDAYQVGQEVPLRCYVNDRDGRVYAIPDSLLQPKD